MLSRYPAQDRQHADHRWNGLPHARGQFQGREGWEFENTNCRRLGGSCKRHNPALPGQQPYYLCSRGSSGKDPRSSKSPRTSKSSGCCKIGKTAGTPPPGKSWTTRHSGKPRRIRALTASVCTRPPCREASLQTACQRPGWAFPEAAGGCQQLANPLSQASNRFTHGFPTRDGQL